MGAYDDIISLPRPAHAGRGVMPLGDRAAQFAPFAALTGYEAAIDETARLTERRPELDEEAQSEVNERLRLLCEALPEAPEAEFLWFRPDGRKEGGACVTTRGRLRHVDLGARRLLLRGGEVIPLDDLLAVSGAMFRDREEGSGQN